MLGGAFVEDEELLVGGADADRHEAEVGRRRRSC